MQSFNLNRQFIIRQFSENMNAAMPKSWLIAVAKPWILALALFSALSSLAEEMPAQPSKLEVTQKLQLVKMLVAKPPLTERTADNKDEQGIQSMALVGTLYTKANDAFIAGNMVLADAFLNEALSLIEDGARLESDPLQAETKLRTRYAELLEELRAYQSTYQDVRKSLSAKNVKPLDAEIERTAPLINSSQAMAHSGKYLEASELLEKVHAVYINTLNKLLASSALIYDNEFKSPAEEFDHELARYHSYQDLIPIARTQLNPDEATLNLANSFVQNSLKEHDIAKNQAAKGDHANAIHTMQGATRRLQTALRTIGLAIPE